MARKEKKKTAEDLAAEVAIVKRRGLAFDFRIAGLSYRAIAAKLNVSHETIRQDIESELQRQADANADKAGIQRELELERLDKYIRALDHWIDAGNIGAVGMAVRVMERRAKLLGLDAPLKQENNDNLEIIIRREDNNAAYTVPAPGRNIKQSRTVQSGSNRAAGRKNDAGETVH